MPREVSEVQACLIAKAIAEELPADRPNLESQCLIDGMTRLSTTGHEPRLFRLFQQSGLVADIPDTYVELSPGFHHPTVSFRDTVQCLSDCGKMDLLLGNYTQESFLSFWDRFGMLEPAHPVFTVHAGHLGRVIPLLCHCDEGTSQKKRSLMILQTQPFLGRGTSFGAAGVNFVGNSLTTRFLYSVLRGKAYSGKNSERLHRLIHFMACDLRSLFEDAIAVQAWGENVELFFCLLGLKGDWVGLAKIGRLNRHHLRDTHDGDGVGVCHLCNAGKLGHEWHRWTTKAMDSMIAGADLPWSTPSAFTTEIPQADDCKANFFKIDIFHTMHKGIVGDLVANAIVTCKPSLELLFVS